MNLSINLQSIKPLPHTIPAISTKLVFDDYLGAMKVRMGFGRDNYSITPGLYKIGNPNSESDVLVSSNYKLSFDIVRKNLESLDVWILVIDTKGVNVWCAAGKGTFGTDNIIQSIKNTSLEQIVKHRKIIVPQLGAPGVAAHIVKELSGFRVIYGPIRAEDIKKFIQDGYKATPAMRKMIFPIKERAKLIPVDFMYGKYKLLVIVSALFVLSGLDKTGILFSKIIQAGPYTIFNIIGAYIAGIVIAPLMLPFTPFRAFALKGAIWGFMSTLFLYMILKEGVLDAVSFGFINISIASFMMMNFTGSSTYTSLSGVKKEMKWAIPFQIAFAAIGLILFIISKFL